MFRLGRKILSGVGDVCVDNWYLDLITDNQLTALNRSVTIS